MDQFRLIISQIINKTDESSQQYHKLLKEIKKNQKEISTNETKNIDHSILFKLIKTKINGKILRNQPYKFLSEFANFVYKINSQLRLLIYQIIPLILTKYVQYFDQKIIHLENLIKVIYNHQYTNLNKNLISRQLITKNESVGELYREHFHSLIKSIHQTPNLSEIAQEDEINSLNRASVKSVLLMTMFHNLGQLTENTVVSYLWMIYIYCGGTQQEEKTGISLYLLEKKNMFSIFKYYISFEQISIILLTLYSLSMQRKKNKFQILSAINMIHKKAANESMFKLSEVAQSTIHLLEDQYSETFQ